VPARVLGRKKPCSQEVGINIIMHATKSKKKVTAEVSMIHTTKKETKSSWLLARTRHF